MVQFREEEVKHPILKGRQRRRAKRRSAGAKGEEKPLYWKSPNGDVVESSLSPDKKQRTSSPSRFRKHAEIARRRSAEEFERSELSKTMVPTIDSMFEERRSSSPDKKHRPNTPTSFRINAQIARHHHAEEFERSECSKTNVTGKVSTNKETAPTPGMKSKSDDSNEGKMRQSQLLEVHSLYSDEEKDDVLSIQRKSQWRKSLDLSSLHSKHSPADCADNSELETLKAELANKDAAIRLACDDKERSLLNEACIRKELSRIRNALGKESTDQIQEGQESRFEETKQEIAELVDNIAELLQIQVGFDLQDSRGQSDDVDLSRKSLNSSGLQLAGRPQGEPETRFERATALSNTQAHQVKCLQDQLTVEQRSTASLRISESALRKQVGKMKDRIADLMGSVKQKHLALEACENLRISQSEELRVSSKSIEKLITEKGELQEVLDKAKCSILTNQLEQNAAEIENRGRTIATLAGQNRDAKQLLEELKVELESCKMEQRTETEMLKDELKLATSHLSDESKVSKAIRERNQRLECQIRSLEGQLASVTIQHEGDKERNTKKLETVEGESSRLSEKVTELEKRQEEWELKSKMLNGEIQQLHSRIGELQASLASRELEITTCRKELGTCKEERANLEFQNDKLLLLNSEASKLNDHLKEDIENLKADKNGLNDRLAGLKASAKELQNQVCIEKEETQKAISALKLGNEAAQQATTALEVLKEREIDDRKASEAAIEELEADRSKLRASLSQANTQVEHLETELLESRAQLQKYQDQSNEEMRKRYIELSTLKENLTKTNEESMALKEALRVCEEKLGLASASKEIEQKLRRDLCEAQCTAEDRRVEFERKCLELEQAQEANEKRLQAQQARHQVAIGCIKDQLGELKSENTELEKRCNRLVSSKIRLGKQQQREASRRQLEIDTNLKKAVDKAALIVQLANSDLDKSERPAHGDKTGVKRPNPRSPSHMRRQEEARSQVKPSMYVHLSENAKSDNVAMALDDGPTITYDGKALCFQQRGKQTITIHSDSEDDIPLY